LWTQLGSIIFFLNLYLTFKKNTKKKKTKEKIFKEVALEPMAQCPWAIVKKSPSMWVTL